MFKKGDRFPHSINSMEVPLCDLQDLAAVLTMGMEEAEIVEFADGDLELMKEILVWMQPFHAENQQQSMLLGQAICVLVTLRMFWANGIQLEPAAYEGYSRYNPRAPWMSMEQKLRPCSTTILTHKFEEMLANIAWIKARLDHLSTSSAFAEWLWPAHCLIRDDLAHVQLALKLPIQYELS